MHSNSGQNGVHTIKRSQWELGQITQLNVSADRKLRSVALKTEHGVLIRPIMEIYPLEITVEPDMKTETAAVMAPGLAADSTHADIANIVIPGHTPRQ